MRQPLDLALELSKVINDFPLGNCGPSDDPDKQYAYTCEFRDIAIRFQAAIKRIGDPDLSEQINLLNFDISNFISDAHLLRANLYPIIDQLHERSNDPSYGQFVADNYLFLHKDIIAELKTIKDSKFDLSKLIKMCEELNDSYARANYIASALLIRSVMNHVPPIFGENDFNNVVAQSGRSIKAVLKRLNEEARPIADLHAHFMIREKESLPSKNQLEPYKPGFEVLLHEVISRVSTEKISNNNWCGTATLPHN